MKLLEQETETIIELEESLKLSELKAVLQAAIEIKKSIIVRASDVTEINTAEIQLLLSFCLTAVKNKIECKWEGMSPAILNAWTILGMQKLYKLN